LLPDTPDSSCAFNLLKALIALNRVASRTCLPLKIFVRVVSDTPEARDSSAVVIPSFRHSFFNSAPLIAITYKTLGKLSIIFYKYLWKVSHS
jgi:hypothetical protein